MSEWKSDQPNSTGTADTIGFSPLTQPRPCLDFGHFSEGNEVRFAGRHLLIELWSAKHLDDAEQIEAALVTAAKSAGATILNTHVHTFAPSGGVTGVVLLAESHISIHTWPECGFAAIDIFMCGSCNPHEAVPALIDAFAPGNFMLAEHKRGCMRR